jgi:4'-phosphopantetheinyl transferase
MTNAPLPVVCKLLRQGFSGLPHRADRLGAEGALAVWRLATDAVRPSDMQRWLSMLDCGERERASRFRIEADRREFVAAHALLRAMLTYYFDVPVLAWRFLVDANGKPRVDPNVGPHEVQFNLSHTRGLVAVALASHGAIGVDVEAIDEAKADLTIAEAYFAPSEVELLQQAAPCERARAFFRLWTLKEAYIKAIGKGLSAPLNSFAFTFEPIRIAFLHGPQNGVANWRFAILPASDRHVLSIAADRLDCEAMRPATRALAPQDL